MKKELICILLLSMIVLSMGCTIKPKGREMSYGDENVNVTYPNWKPLELSEGQLVKVVTDNEEFALLVANFTGSSVVFGKALEEKNFGHQNFVMNTTGAGNVRGNEFPQETLLRRQPRQPGHSG